MYSEKTEAIRIIRDEDKLKDPESYKEYEKRRKKLKYRAKKWPIIGHLLFLFGAGLFSVNLGPIFAGEGLPISNLLLGIGMMVSGIAMEWMGKER